MKRRVIIIGAVFAVAVCAVVARFLVLGCGNSRFRAEYDHGISLPQSARNIQCKGDAWHGFLDRGAVTLFEMSHEDLRPFLSQLRIRSRNGPAKTGAGDPCIGGWNVWPTGSSTACPGNPEYCGFKPTWGGFAIPREMLSCDSPVGDWLHVEVWDLSATGLVVKLCTNWH